MTNQLDISYLLTGIIHDANNILAKFQYQHILAVKVPGPEVQHVLRKIDTACTDLAEIFEEIRRDPETRHNIMAQHTRLTDLAHSLNDYTLYLREVLPDNQRLREGVEVMEGAAREIYFLIARLVAVCQTGQDLVDRQTFSAQSLYLSLNPFVESLATVRAGTDQPWVRWNYRPETEITADPGQLRQCLLNLIINAFEAIREKGVVRLTITEVENGVRFAVEDNGPGMDPEAACHCLHPRYSTKNRGSGMGLTMVQYFVTLHNGQLEPIVTGPHGTTVSFSLPNH